MFDRHACNMVVAIIDTGIDAAHVDLNNGKVLAWQDWVNNKPTPYDDHGHGSHVSGIVAGTGTGDPNYTGVAPGAALIGLKVLDQNGSGTLSNVAAAVDWAVQHKSDYNIRVISMSRRQMRIMCGRRPARGRCSAAGEGAGHGPQAVGL
ncbi:MAG TPA: S8 family serine peptidase [Symbiobacteriaceae bacterium]|jgi:serine protease AprX